MIFGGISPGSLLLILLIIVMLFGTKKLRTIGEDLGYAFKSFKKGLKEENIEKIYINKNIKKESPKTNNKQ